MVCTRVSGPSDFCQEVCHVKTGWEPRQTISSSSGIVRILAGLFIIPAVAATDLQLKLD